MIYSIYLGLKIHFIEKMIIDKLIEFSTWTTDKRSYPLNENMYMKDHRLTCNQPHNIMYIVGEDWLLVVMGYRHLSKVGEGGDYAAQNQHGLR